MSSNREKIGNNTIKTSKRNFRVKVTLNGPYIVIGNVPLSKMVIETDDEGYPYRWREVETYPQRESYALCRCGKSKNKPYCDNTHKKIGFDGTETAGYASYLENVKIYDGPELKLTDNRDLCVGSGFCTRAGNIWNLTVHSDNPDYKKTAIQEAADCPSGRLVLWNKQSNPIEPDFGPSIVITENDERVPGPIWVRGEILIESADKLKSETRNRVTLCRCGRSNNKPLCDGSHLDT
jgi:CDGSH-type Zn-finger protein